MPGTARTGPFCARSRCCFLRWPGESFPAALLSRCFLTLPHSANTQLALAMHLAYLILTVFLGQLLGTTGQITVTQEDGEVTVKQGHPFQTTYSNFSVFFCFLPNLPILQ